MSLVSCGGVGTCAPFPWGTDGTGCSLGKRQASGGSVLL